MCVQWLSADLQQDVPQSDRSSLPLSLPSRELPGCSHNRFGKPSGPLLFFFVRKAKALKEAQNLYSLHREGKKIRFFIHHRDCCAEVHWELKRCTRQDIPIIQPPEIKYMSSCFSDRNPSSFPLSVSHLADEMKT